MKCTGWIVPWRASRAKRCSGGDFSTVHAGQEIVALDQNSGARARLVGGGRDRPHHSTVAGHFRALASSCPIGERQAKFQIGLNLKKIFSPEQNSGARNILDGRPAPDRFSHVAEVYGHMKRESRGTHVLGASAMHVPTACAVLEQKKPP